MRRAELFTVIAMFLIATSCTPPVPTPSASRITAGGYHTCAVMSDGTVRCWGQNEEGQLGTGAIGPFSIANATTVTGLTSVVDVSAGLLFTCAVEDGGSVSCWGADDSGQLGDSAVGAPAVDAQPHRIVGLSAVKAVGAGDHHACAVTDDGAVYCWGSDLNGQLGDGVIGAPANGAVPQVVAGIGNATDVEAGANFTCALLASGEIACWGNDDGGTLGDGIVGSPSNRPTPRLVSGISTATAITAGSDSACALLADGSAVCWGWDGVGELGDGIANQSAQPVPSTVVGLPPITAISAGAYHACAVSTTGAVSCWGRDQAGALGDGVVGPQISPTPGPVVGLADARLIDAGALHTCAVRTTGGIRCWGSDGAGQLGDGVTGEPYDNPTPVDVVGV